MPTKTKKKKATTEYQRAKGVAERLENGDHEILTDVENVTAFRNQLGRFGTAQQKQFTTRTVEEGLMVIRTK